MMLKADLHIHTTCSDGTFSPKQIIDMASRRHIRLISITDHDCVDAYTEELFSYAESKNVTLIPGVEMSCRREGRDVHILGYNYDVHSTEIHDTLALLQRRRDDRCKRILEKLDAIGIHITYDEIKAQVKGSIGRPHIGRLIIQKGYAVTMKEVFERFLGDKGSCFVEKETLSTEETIAFIKNCGGISVLAHPHLIENDRIVCDVIREGVQGIEVYYHGMPRENCRLYYSRAKERNLFITGGSDFHGKRRNEMFGENCIHGKYAQALINRKRVL